jgi:hypothetical protein
MNPSKLPRYCSSCGALLALESRFCNQCGAPIEAIPPTQKAEVPSPAYQAPVPPAYTPAPPAYVVEPPRQEPKKPNRLPLILAIVFGGLACCCVCVVLARLGYNYLVDLDDEPTPLAEQATETPAPAPATAYPTEPPAPPSPTTPPGREASYSNVRFYYDPLIAQDVLAETVPGSNYADAPEFDLYPDHIHFTLIGYPLYQESIHNATISVYPADTYAAMNPSAAQVITDLKNLLATRPQSPPGDILPFLPIWNAAQLMQANMRYLDFQTGSGVRFVTQFGQDVYPIHNGGIFYTFQGLNSDGAYYISTILPVQNAVLPDPDTVVMDEAFYNNFKTYVEEMEILLSAQPDASFTPDLSLLDAMIQSISVR